MSDWQHAALAQDLAEKFFRPQQRMFREASFGSWASGGFADVASIRLSWTEPLPTIYEVKVARSDLVRDLRTGKWRRYLPWCERFYFAIPEGLGEGIEWPREAGVLERTERGWDIWRRSKRRPLSAEQKRMIFFAYMMSAMKPRHNGVCPRCARVVE